MENDNENTEEKKEFQKFTLDGVSYKTTLTNKWLAHKPYVERDPCKIYSFIPGTILKVFIKDGQKVKMGEQLLILQAMKMDNVLTSPVVGVIKKLYVAAGDKVANKQLLVELEGEIVVKKKEKKKKPVKK
jgi:biotin carboxyl carrier protein